MFLQMSKFFSAYRIDHILGFFRIWEMPDHAVTGIAGKFRPSLPLTQVRRPGFEVSVEVTHQLLASAMHRYETSVALEGSHS